MLSCVDVDINTNCWNWKKAKDKSGYGQTGLKGKSYKAHRVFYSVFKGDIEKGMVIDHICKNTSCVNPDHLRSVTSAENVLNNSNSIQAINKLKKACKNGHPYTKESTSTTNGGRYCKICEKIRKKNKWQITKAKNLAQRAATMIMIQFVSIIF